MAMFRTPINRTAIGSLVVVMTVALSVAACGSSAPTAAAYNSQANKICQMYSAKLKSVGADLALAKSNSKKFKSDLAGALTEVEQSSSQLQDLTRPNGENRALTQAFNAQNIQIKNLRDVLNASKKGNEKAVAMAETAFEESEAPLNQKFDVLGLTECGSG
jgi:hypothetical protein